MNTRTKTASIIVTIVAIIIIIILVASKGKDSSDTNINVGTSTDTTVVVGATSTKPGTVSTSTKPSGTTASSGSVSNTTGKADDSKVTAAGVNEVVAADNEFATNLYLQLAKKEKGNIFFSPYSITNALGMVYEGARGTTASEIAKVLSITNPATHRSAVARIYNDLNTPSSSYTLRTANALWVEKTSPLATPFLQTVNTYYKAGLSNVDFRGNAETSRGIINAWVLKQTNDKIKELIPTGVLNSDTRLVLTDAIYFKGKWLTQFDKTQTKQMPFTVDTTTTAYADMMSNLSGKEFNYAESSTGQMLELPYAGGKLSMIIVLQKDGSVQPNDVLNLKKSLKKQKVNIYIPRFKAETQYSLNDSLKTLGMPTAFSDAADFSGINASGGLQISEVVHKAFVEVNEEGTEAAAATGVLVSVTSVQEPVAIPEFKADHPFLFMIRDMKTDEVLFMGKVANPNL